MSISAASSAVLASAPPPQRYALGQSTTSYQADNLRANIEKAKKFSGFDSYRFAYNTGGGGTKQQPKLCVASPKRAI